MQHEARFPNFGTGGLLSPATTSVTMSRDTDVPNNTITSSTFSGKSNNFYANARFMGAFGGAWSWQNAVVTNSSGSTLTFDLATKSTPWWPGTESWQSNTGIGFVYGLLNLLDADGEWHFAPSTSLLSLRIAGGNDPTSRQVEIKRRNWCVNINGVDYITVRGIKTVGGAIKLNGVGNVLSDCDASYLSHFLTFSNGYKRDGGKAQGGGVILGGSGGAVRNCTISNTAGPGVYTSGTEHNITRNKIFNANYAGIFTGGVVLDGKMYRGSGFAAGEIGQMSIHFDGKPGHYGNLGALEKYTGNQQIAEHAVLRYAEAGITKDIDDCTPKMIAAAAQAGDDIARQIWGEIADWLGTAISSIAWLLNPDAFVVLNQFFKWPYMSGAALRCWIPVLDAPSWLACIRWPSVC
jgi:hypothetical protein